MRILAGAMFLGISLSVTQAHAVERQPAWRTSYADAYEAGKQARRPVLVVIDKPAEPEYRVEQVSGIEERPGPADAALLAKFELCHIDASTEYGQKVAGLFGANQFPHIAITDRRVEVLLFERNGRMSPAEWTAALVKYQHGEIERPAVICST